MSTFANSEDPEEMQHNAAFHQGLRGQNSFFLRAVSYGMENPYYLLDDSLECAQFS